MASSEPGSEQLRFLIVGCDDGQAVQNILNNAPTTLLQLEQRIKQSICEITVDQLHNVFESFVERCELGVRFGGKLSGWTGD